MSSIISDLPCYLVMNITLALIWQWHLIGNMLRQPEAESESISSGKSQKRLYWSQLGLGIFLGADVILLIAHYQFSFLKNFTVIDSHTVQQDPRWINVRLGYKVIQIAIYILLEVIAVTLFLRIIKALPKEAEYAPVRRQANVFICIFFTESLLRIIG